MQNNKTKIKLLCFLLFMVIIKGGEIIKSMYLMILTENKDFKTAFNPDNYTSFLFKYGCFYHIMKIYIDTIGKISDAYFLSPVNRNSKRCLESYRQIYRENLYKHFFKSIKLYSINDNPHIFNVKWSKIQSETEEILNYGSDDFSLESYEKFEYDLIKTLDEITKFAISMRENHRIAKYVIKTLYNINHLEQLDMICEFSNIVFSPNQEKAEFVNLNIKKLASFRKFYCNFDTIFISLLHKFSIYEDASSNKKIVGANIEAISDSFIHFLICFDCAVSELCANAKLKKNECMQFVIHFDQIGLKLFSKLWLSKNEEIFSKISNLVEQIEKTIFSFFSEYRKEQIKYDLYIFKDINIINLTKCGSKKEKFVANYDKHILKTVLKVENCLASNRIPESNIGTFTLDYKHNDEKLVDMCKNRIIIEEKLHLIADFFRKHLHLFEEFKVEKAKLYATSVELHTFFLQVCFIEDVDNSINYKGQLDIIKKSENKNIDENLMKNQAQSVPQAKSIQKKKSFLTNNNPTVLDQSPNKSLFKLRSFEKSKADIKRHQKQT